MLPLLSLTSPPASAQPLSDLVFAVGTTYRDSLSRDWSYVLIGSPQPSLLAGKRFAVYGKPGFPTNAATFTLRGTMFQQTDPTAVNSLLTQSVFLGQNLGTLSNALNVLLHSVPGITSQPLPQKVLTAFQVATADPGTAQAVALLEQVNPGFKLCAGHAFSEQIPGAITYEVREVNSATGATGDVVGRVTVDPAAPVVLPAPGFPFQVATNDPGDHLRIRLRWGTPPELRRLALLQFGFNVWHIPRAAAEAGNFHLVPPTPAQLHTNPNFTRANAAPVMAIKDFSAAHGLGGADDPTDRTTYFCSDDNGRASGNPPFPDGAQFYYFITARDVLGRDGLVSPGGLATACRRLRPLAPTDPRVVNDQQTSALIGGGTTNRPFLRVTWQQNTRSNDLVTEYWVYRWPNPAMAMTNDAAPLGNRIAVVPQRPGTNLNSYLDNGAGAPVVPGLSNFWYTVRAVSQAACDPLLSPHSPPAWGVLRERVGPPPTTGDVLGSCGTPGVIFQTFNTLSNAPATEPLGWNYRFTCQRRDPGIAWVQFVASNTVGTVETFGPLFFPPDGNVAQADYSVLISGFNQALDVWCVVGTFYGRTSAPVVGRFTAAVGPPDRQEAVFLAGQLLLTALDSSDPLLLAASGGQSQCLPAINPTPDASGTVRMQFDLLGRCTAVLVQALSNGVAWTDVGVATPDANCYYYVSYPACLIEPLPQFRGCLVNLPEDGGCEDHVARAADDGPVAPILVRFRLTPRTREYRLYRRVDDGPLTLVAQAAAPFDPLNPNKQIIRTDDAMPPSPSRLCYYVQVLDEHGNGSPMAFLGCKEVKPAKLPRPVLAEPHAAGDAILPQVVLNWFCPTAGVRRFEVLLERADQPGSGKPTGFRSSKLTGLATHNVRSRYFGLFRQGFALAHFDESQITPPIGASFGPGPQFTLSADVFADVPYNISIVAVDGRGHAGDASQVWKFIWKPPVVLANVPWPARPPPPVKEFDEDQNNATQPFHPRVRAVLLRSSFSQALDQRYPVGIRIGQFDYALNPVLTVGSTNPISYQTVAGVAGSLPDAIPFKRESADPSRRGDPLLPVVVYRQQVTNAAFPRVSGNVTQVSPLIERLPWSVVYCFDCNPIRSTITIWDRLLASGWEVNPPPDDVSGNFLYVRDQQPVILGAKYRYFVVRLNDQREIAEIITAGEVEIPTNL